MVCTQEGLYIVGAWEGAIYMGGLLYIVCTQEVLYMVCAWQDGIYVFYTGGRSMWFVHRRGYISLVHGRVLYTWGGCYISFVHRKCYIWFVHGRMAYMFFAREGALCGLYTGGAIYRWCMGGCYIHGGVAIYRLYTGGCCIHVGLLCIVCARHSAILHACAMLFQHTPDFSLTITPRIDPWDGDCEPRNMAHFGPGAWCRGIFKKSPPFIWAFSIYLGRLDVANMPGSLWTPHCFQKKVRTHGWPPPPPPPLQVVGYIAGHGPWRVLQGSLRRPCWVPKSQGRWLVSPPKYQCAWPAIAPRKISVHIAGHKASPGLQWAMNLSGATCWKCALKFWRIPSASSMP